MLLGITELLEFVDAPVPAVDLARYRGIARPFSGSLVLGVERRALVADLVGVHPPSVSAVDLSGVTVRVMTGGPGPRPPIMAVAGHPGRGLGLPETG